MNKASSNECVIVVIRYRVVGYRGAARWIMVPF